MFRILAIAATLLGAASAAQADVYRWTDANGTVQYSDRWVPGSVLVKSDRSSPSPEPQSEPESQDASTPPADPPADPVAQQQAERTVQQDVARVKAENCKKLREQYDQALQSRRIYRENEKGERTFLSDPEADKYRVELLNRRKEACGS